MAGKIGEEFVKDMIGRGFRELGGTLYPDSNIAQPMYPLRGGYAKQPEAPTVEAREESVLDEHLVAAGRGTDPRDLEEPEHDRY